MGTGGSGSGNPFDLFGLLGDIGGSIGSVLGLGDWGYDKWRQQQQWNREDTAIQRRVADYKAAGLSPVLAAGGGGAATSVVSQKGPPDIQEGVLKALATRQAQAQIAKTQADARMSNAQAIKAQAEAQVAGSNAQYQSGILMRQYEKLASEVSIAEQKFKTAITEEERARIARDIDLKERDMAEIQRQLMRWEFGFKEWNKAFQYGGQLISGVKDVMGFFKPNVILKKHF